MSLSIQNFVKFNKCVAITVTMQLLCKKLIHVKKLNSQIFIVEAQMHYCKLQPGAQPGLFL